MLIGQLSKYEKTFEKLKEYLFYNYDIKFFIQFSAYKNKTYYFNFLDFKDFVFEDKELYWYIIEFLEENNILITKNFIYPTKCIEYKVSVSYFIDGNYAWGNINGRYESIEQAIIKSFEILEDRT